MARIRTIKPEFWSSEQVMECSRDARLLFIGLWNFCDDKGRMAYSPKRIKAQVLPGDDLTAESIHVLITELTQHDLVRLYEIEDKEYLQVTGWHHQVINRPQQSKIPDPVNATSVSGHGTHTAGREGKGREGKEESKPASVVLDPAREPAGWLSVEIVKAFEAAGNPNIPNTDRVGVWLSQGFEPAICIAVIRDVLAKKPNVRGLSYFDQPIREAHDKRAPKNGIKQPSLAAEEAERWRTRLRGWVGKPDWDRTWAWGPEPGKTGCYVPAAILREFGLKPTADMPDIPMELDRRIKPEAV